MVDAGHTVDQVRPGERPRATAGSAPSGRPGRIPRCRVRRRAATRGAPGVRRGRGSASPRAGWERPGPPCARSRTAQGVRFGRRRSWARAYAALTGERLSPRQGRRVCDGPTGPGDAARGHGGSRPGRQGRTRGLRRGCDRQRGVRRCDGADGHRDRQSDRPRDRPRFRPGPDDQRGAGPRGHGDRWHLGHQGGRHRDQAVLRRRHAVPPAGPLPAARDPPVPPAAAVLAPPAPDGPVAVQRQRRRRGHVVPDRTVPDGGRRAGHACGRRRRHRAHRPGAGRGRPPGVPGDPAGQPPLPAAPLTVGHAGAGSSGRAVRSGARVLRRRPGGQVTRSRSRRDGALRRRGA